MLRKLLTPIEDDTEEAPWMVMGMPQSNAASTFYLALRSDLRSRPEPPLVAMMLPIRYYPIPGGDPLILSPDVLVAPVSPYIRNSYDVAREGTPPTFVLEVGSPESEERDFVIKPDCYEVMGVQEYALYAPPTPDGRMRITPRLQGYHRDARSDEFVRWTPDSAGRLYSDVLTLWLVVRDGELHAQRPDGSWVLTHEEAVEALGVETQARLREERLRRDAEAEIARLRAELERRQQK